MSLLVEAPETAGLALAAEMYGPSMGELPAVRLASFQHQNGCMYPCENATLAAEMYSPRMGGDCRRLVLRPRFVPCVVQTCATTSDPVLLAPQMCTSAQ